MDDGRWGKQRSVRLGCLVGLILLLISSCIVGAVWFLQVPLAPLKKTLAVTTPLCGVWQSTAGESLSLSDTTLRDVAAVGMNDVWAVGYRRDFFGEAQALIVHWDGAQWTSVTSPNLGYTTLSAVA